MISIFKAFAAVVIISVAGYGISKAVRPPLTIFQSRKQGNTEGTIDHQTIYGSSDSWGEIYKYELVSMSSKNDWWWKKQDIKFFGKRDYSRGIGAQAEDKDLGFKDLYLGNKYISDVSTFHVKQKCLEVYTKPKDKDQDLSKKRRREIFMFCANRG
ncbi:hypothetical protein [Candidatus Mycoplasma haematohominis]|uniref:hypothetical protein n=1 Tax=Candidatus Mycoplasma haematohominis TaxID=1494318 RepID=UPI001C0A6AF9|nr:hypothetical protein [Candidatus Mycoplasma haemohominis]